MSYYIKFGIAIIENLDKSLKVMLFFIINESKNIA